MLYKARTVRTLLLLTGFVALAPFLGCGGGGGSAAVGESRGSDFTGPTSNLANTTTTLADGCSVEALSPNFAGLIHPLYHWTRFPVKVFFANAVTITDPNGTRSDLRSVALRGFQEWSDATGGQITIQVSSDAGSADIVVHLDSLSAVPTTKDILGIEQSTLDSKGNLQHADIKLNTWPDMSAENIVSFQETAAHEFGHALGINGHSNDPTDVMYASHSLYVFKPLSQRDINTLKTAYCTSGKSASDADRSRTITLN